jgi:hypothetical protein
MVPAINALTPSSLNSFLLEGMAPSAALYTSYMCISAGKPFFDF